MPAGGGLVQPPPQRPAQREGQAGAADEPGGVLAGGAGEAGEAGGLGDGQFDGGDAGRAGLPAAGRDGRVAEGYAQVGVADDAAAGRGCAGVVVAGGGGGEGDAAGERAADGGGPELGEGREGGVPADAVPGAGLRLVPAEDVLARFERFFYGPAAPGDGDEAGHGGRPARRRPGQVEGVAVRAGDQPPDQQALPADGGGGHRPVAVAGAFGPVPARAPLEDRVLDGLVSADRRAGRQGDLVVAWDDRHIRQPGLRGLLAELLAAAIDLIERNPAGWQPGRGQPVQLVHGQLRFGGELQIVRDPGGP